MQRHKNLSCALIPLSLALGAPAWAGTIGPYCNDDTCGNDAVDVGVCGNGVCESMEEMELCWQDCDQSPTAISCGDGTCHVEVESAASCPQDCAQALRSTYDFCGDGTCHVDIETAATCPADCGEPVCGNGMCESREEMSSCQQDCYGFDTFEEQWLAAGTEEKQAMLRKLSDLVAEDPPLYLDALVEKGVIVEISAVPGGTTFHVTPVVEPDIQYLGSFGFDPASLTLVFHYCDANRQITDAEDLPHATRMHYARAAPGPIGWGTEMLDSYSPVVADPYCELAYRSSRIDFGRWFSDDTNIVVAFDLTLNPYWEVREAEGAQENNFAAFLLVKILAPTGDGIARLYVMFDHPLLMWTFDSSGPVQKPTGETLAEEEREYLK